MGHDKILETLAAEFALLIRTAYHVQIDTGEDSVHRYHNIWLKDGGGIRLQLAGARASEWVTTDELLIKLRAYDYKTTDFALMQFVRRIERIGHVGIFTDAGFKEGQAKLAIVRVMSGGAMDIHVRRMACSNSAQAECEAVRLATTIYAVPQFEDIIYTDCLEAAQRFAPRAQWLSRDKNKRADALANMRGKTSGAPDKNV